MREAKTKDSSDVSKTSDSKKELLEMLRLNISFLKEKHSLTKEELLEIFMSEEMKVPVSIFTTSLGPSESLVKYLKEEKSMTYHEIASALNRDDRTVWGTYNKAHKKMGERFSSFTGPFLPLPIFSDRQFSVLESLTLYLKDDLGIVIKKIASMLHKNKSTIWTSYNRGKSKGKKGKA